MFPSSPYCPPMKKIKLSRLAERIPTEGQLLPGVRGQGEAQHRHRGDQHTRDDQVEEVVQRPPPDLDLESDVKIGLRTTVVHLGVPGGWNFCKEEGILSVQIV